MQYRDGGGRYEFQHGRDWHVVSPEDSPQMVLHLMDRGDFIAQATLTPWKKIDPKMLPTPDDFQKLVGDVPGWEEEQVLEKPAKLDGTAGGYTAYRSTASGNLDGVKAVQAFYLVVGPQGEQMIATFSIVPTQVQKLGAHDVELGAQHHVPGQHRADEIGVILRLRVSATGRRARSRVTRKRDITSSARHQ